MLSPRRTMADLDENTQNIIDRHLAHGLESATVNINKM